NFEYQGTQSGCIDEILTLTVDSDEEVIWNDDLVSNSIEHLVAGDQLITFSLSNEFGCQVDSSIQITAHPSPEINIITPVEVCAGETINVIAEATGTLEWNGIEADNFSATLEQDSLIHLAITNDFWCTTDSNLLLLAHPIPNINILSELSACIGESLTIEADSEGELSWNGQEPSANFTTIIEMDTPLLISSVNQFGCQRDSTVLLEAHPIPSLTIEGEVEYCEGDLVNLQATSDGEILWNNELLQDYFEELAEISTTIEVESTSAEGCSTVSAIDLTVHPFPESEIQILGNQISTTAGNEYQWYLDGQAIQGANSSEYMILESGNYSVLVTSLNGCQWQSEDFFMNYVSVEERPNTEIQWFPNPASSILSFSNTVHGDIIKIYDASGKLITTNTINLSSINIENIANGMYALSIIRNGQRIHHGRLMINHN
ncbi:MAG: T9SS type A sorting domain-containing protein, partial [Bacteroidota bacterium]